MNKILCMGIFALFFNNYLIGLESEDSEKWTLISIASSLDKKDADISNNGLIYCPSCAQKEQEKLKRENLLLERSGDLSLLEDSNRESIFQSHYNQLSCIDKETQTEDNIASSYSSENSFLDEPPQIDDRDIVLQIEGEPENNEDLENENANEIPYIWGFNILRDTLSQLVEEIETDIREDVSFVVSGVQQFYADVIDVFQEE